MTGFPAPDHFCFILVLFQFVYSSFLRGTACDRKHYSRSVTHMCHADQSGTSILSFFNLGKIQLSYRHMWARQGLGVYSYHHDSFCSLISFFLAHRLMSDQFHQKTSSYLLKQSSCTGQIQQFFPGTLLLQQVVVHNNAANLIPATYTDRNYYQSVSSNPFHVVVFLSNLLN